MKHKYKLLIVCAVSLVLLLCSVVGVSAESVDSSNYMLNYYIADPTGGATHVNISNGATSVHEDIWDTQQHSWDFTHRLTFVDTDLGMLFQKGRNYTFTVNNLYYEVCFWDETRASDDKFVRYITPSIIPTFNSAKTYIVYVDNSIDAITAEYIYNPRTGGYSITSSFKPELDVQRIVFTFNLETYVGFNFTTLQTRVRIGSLWQAPYQLDISVQSEEAEILGEINNSVQEGTDEITNGWTPNPETPDNADDVGELGSIEEQLQSGSEEGINAGMDMITGLGDSLAGFQKGFIFLIDLFDEFTGTVPWLSSVITIGLSLGIVAFLLNIVGSVASKISRDERRAEADKRRAEADARREKRQYSR